MWVEDLQRVSTHGEGQAMTWPHVLMSCLSRENCRTRMQNLSHVHPSAGIVIGIIPYLLHSVTLND